MPIIGFVDNVDFTKVAECMNSTMARATNIQPRLTMVGATASFAKRAGKGHVFYAEDQPTWITLKPSVAGLEDEVVRGPSLDILMVMGPPPARQVRGEFESENKGISVLPSVKKLVISPVVPFTSVHEHGRHLEALACILSCNVELMLPMVASDTCCR